MKSLNKIVIVAMLLLLSAGVANAQTNKAYGDNMRQIDSVLVGSVWQPVFGIYSGDITQDGFIDILDLPVLLHEINDDPFPYGYLNEDINGDGFVDILDLPLELLNINQQITLVRPF